jgi:aminoglycoside 6'-N-acetyltransferase I
MSRADAPPHLKPATRDDRAAWLRLREALWPTAPGETSDHEAEVDAFFAGATRVASIVLLAFENEASAAPIGFAEISIRSQVEGCSSDRVAYLEGWYVVPEQRRRGVGGALVRAAEAWARAQGCTEMGSDVELANTASLAAHLELGFQEEARVVLLRKSL